MTIQIERLRQEIRMENRIFLVQFVLALAARRRRSYRTLLAIPRLGGPT